MKVKCLILVILMLSIVRNNIPRIEVKKRMYSNSTLHQKSNKNNRRFASSSRRRGDKPKYDDPECQPCDALKSVKDMIITQTDNSQLKVLSSQFYSKVQYMEWTVNELANLIEIYGLRQLEKSLQVSNTYQTQQFVNQFIKQMYTEYMTLSNSLTQGNFQKDNLYSMRSQIYSSIKMVSMIHNVHTTLKFNTYLLSQLNLHQNFFLQTTDYFRLIQVDRVFAKGVATQIIDQINQVQVSHVFDLLCNGITFDPKKDNFIADLISLRVAYINRIQRATDTINQQIHQLQLLQTIEYKFANIDLDTIYTFQSDTMRVIADHLHVIITKDIGVFNDYFGNVLPNNVPGYTNQITQINNLKAFNILILAKTCINLPVVTQFADYLLQKQSLDLNSGYFQQDNVAKIWAILNLESYSTDALKKSYPNSVYINSVIGLDVNAIKQTAITLLSTYDFLYNTYNFQIFQSQIATLFDFTNKIQSEAIFYSVMKSFVSLKQSYDNFIEITQQFQFIQQFINNPDFQKRPEYLDLINLINIKIKNQQKFFNQRLALLNMQLYQDLAQIVVEVRNIVTLYKLAQDQSQYDCKKSQTENSVEIIRIIQNKYSLDLEVLQNSLNQKLNTFFLNQVNVIGNIKSMSHLMIDTLTKMFYKAEVYIVADLKVTTSIIKTLCTQTVSSPPANLQPNRKGMRFAESESEFQDQPAICDRTKNSILFNLIEKSQLYMEVQIVKQTAILNDIFIKIMVNKYKPYAQNTQFLVATMFENFMTTFTDGIVSKQDLIRIDRIIHNSNTLESQQIGQKQNLLVTIQKHKAYLLKIYTDFQKCLSNFASKQQVKVNYVSLSERLKQDNYMFLSDVEPVYIDNESNNYQNTINQLKLSGYDEFILPDYSGDVLLLNNLMIQKKMFDNQVPNKFRIFYCQGCMNRIIYKTEIYNYEDYDYTKLIVKIDNQLKQFANEAKTELRYEIQIIPFFNYQKQQENIVYYVKYIQDVQVINVINDSKQSMNVYSQEILPAAKPVMLTRNVDTSSIVQVTLNIQAVLDYYYQDFERFSIYELIFRTNNQKVIDRFNVRKTILTLSEADNIKNKAQNHNVVNEAYAQLKINFEKYLKIYLVNRVNEENVLRFYSFSVFRKLIVFQSYADLADLQNVFQQFKLEQSFATKFEQQTVNYLSDTIQFYNILCTDSDQISNSISLINQNNQIIVDQNQFRQTARNLFNNQNLYISTTKDFGKVYSKISNVILDYITVQLVFKGSIINQQVIPLNSQGNLMQLVNYEMDNYISNYKFGTNINQVIIFKVNGQNLECSVVQTMDSQLNMFDREFPIKYDMQYLIVKNLLKLAFMFPYKIDNINVNSNKVNFLGMNPVDVTSTIQKRIDSLQSSIDQVFYENNNYGIYVSTMSQACSANEYIRLYVSSNCNTNCLRHAQQTVPKADMYKYSDLIDPSYIVTEVFYYFDAERDQQYIQDLTNINVNDPFYQILFELGFKPVVYNYDIANSFGGAKENGAGPSGSVNGNAQRKSDPYNDELDGFYDFEVNLNQAKNPKYKASDISGGFFELPPVRGMKRVWVRSLKLCSPDNLDINKQAISPDVDSQPKSNLKDRVGQAQKFYQDQVATFSTTYADYVNLASSYQFIDTIVNAYLVSSQIYNQVEKLAQTLLSISQMQSIPYKIISDYIMKIDNDDSTASLNTDYAVLVRDYYPTTATVLYDKTYVSYVSSTQTNNIFSNCDKTITKIGTKRALSIYQNGLIKYGKDIPVNTCQKSLNPITYEQYKNYIIGLFRQSILKQIVIRGSCYVWQYKYINIGITQYIKCVKAAEDQSKPKL